MIANTQRRIVNLWYLLGILFLGLVFLPSIIGLDGMNGGFALSFVSGFMVISSFIVIVIYRSRARQFDKILSGEGRIALWRYSPEEWMSFVSKDFEAEKKLKGMLFMTIAVISIVIGIVLILYFRDLIFIPIIMGIIALIAIPAIWAPRYRFSKLKHSDSEVLIAENGVIVGRMFHLWESTGTSLDKISLNINGNPNVIEFVYSAITRTGRQEEVARVPVPKGKLEEAIKLVEYFNGSRQKDT
ncbi:MAG: hypothetical protein WC780_11715 [Lentimicrobiaceae bacterium]|jgi:hypothetical protein